MPELQRVGHHQAAVELRGGLTGVPTPMLLASSLIACLVAAAIGTRWARRYALARQLVDLPGERRRHAQATPRGGGISIVIVMLGAMLALALLFPSWRFAMLPMAAGLVLVAGIGWVDDHRPLSPWLRLAVHALAALLLGMSMSVLGASALQLLLVVGLAIVLVNVWNFMDGINGLAASQAALAALGYAVFAGTGPAAWLGWMLACTVLGFLPFNFPNARIFLGDVGSGALGYLLAGLAGVVLLKTASSPSGMAWLLLPLSVFLVDASLTLMRRILRGEQWWSPHVQHAYQRWAKSVGSHVIVTCFYAIATLFAIAMTLYFRSSTHQLAWSIIGGWTMLSFAAWCYLQARYRERRIDDEGIGLR
jgi:UDP-N-acetylmuramyl pentapeptide phosphotransferase/UDP-N-acetylglucosamine-1-phosphate transferase